MPWGTTLGWAGQDSPVQWRTTLGGSEQDSLVHWCPTLGILSWDGQDSL